MLEDASGVLVTSESGAAIQRFEAGLRSFLAQRPDTGERLSEALAQDPDLVVGHVLAGFCRMLAARAPLIGEAVVCLERARQALAARGGTRREHALVDALAAWASGGDMWRAAHLLDEALLREPRDVLALRLGHAVRFMLGDTAGMRIALEQALPHWSASDASYPYVLGCHAFALGETGALQRAEDIGRQAVAMRSDDLWAAHAVTHALAGLKRPREAVAWIAWMEPHMTCGGAFVRHIQWHRALAHLSLGEGEMALQQYPSFIWRDGLFEVRDVLNAASLLWRLQAAGLPVRGWMWDELANVAEQRIGEHAWAFADLHYLLCLTGAGRTDQVRAMLASIDTHTRTCDTTQAGVHADVGFTVAQAIAAAAAGNHEQAAAQLGATTPRLARLGGSIAQRAVLEQLRQRAEAACGRRAM